MKTKNITFKFFLTIAVMFLTTTVSFAQYDSIPFDGYDRTYLLHLPTGYSGTDSIPLVIAMHGGFGSADNMQNQSQLSVKADAENFIVVYPEGVKGGGSSRQSCNLTGESPVMSIAHVGHVAIPQPGAGNQPGHAWCKRPVRLDKHRVITVGATWRPSKYESSNIKE